MLSVLGAKIPRKVTIKVAKAENLIESMKDGKKKPNNKFKVIVIGGKKKESSSTEVGSNGNVQWTFCTVIKLHRNQTDPLCILVEDSDGHHKGQVIIPIVKIPPKPYIYSANQDPATSSNIICSELEPTSKCSNPAGFLLYWIWIEEYYPEGAGDSGKKSFNKSVSSLFGSKSKLSGSKTNLEIKNSDSISNFSSISSLNKPEKHKKSSSLLKLKIGGKKKSKPTLSDARITPDSSENDSISNFSFNMENDNNFNKRDHESHKHSSIGGRENINQSMGNPNIVLHNYSKDAKSDIHGHDNHESNLGTKRDNSPLPNATNKYNTMNIQDMSLHKDQPFNNEISPPYSQNEFAPGHKSKVGSDYSLFSDRGSSKAYVDELETIKKENSKLKEENNKFNLCFDEHQSKLDAAMQQVKLLTDNCQIINVENAELKLQNSKFNDQIYQSTMKLEAAEQQVKFHSEEMENVKREIAELKAQNNKYNHQIFDYQSELESVKQTLCKLRLRLLEDGATKYLEI